MANLQRIILILGIAVALFLTFIQPPMYVFSNNIKQDARAVCEEFNQTMQDAETKYKESDCLSAMHAGIDTNRLTIYLAVIVISTGGLAYASRPRPNLS